jgi:hypothetical protein
MDLKVKLLQGLAHKIKIQILEFIKEEKTASQIIGELSGNQSSIF